MMWQSFSDFMDPWKLNIFIGPKNSEDSFDFLIYVFWWRIFVYFSEKIWVVRCVQKFVMFTTTWRNDPI